MESHMLSVFFFFDDIRDAKKIKFDKDDLSEKFNSLEEKKAHALAEALDLTKWRPREIRDFWGKFSIELFEYVFEKEAKDYQKSYFKETYDPSLLEKMGVKHIDEFIQK